MEFQSVIGVAELIVVPTRPSPHDLRAAGATVDLCERAGKPLVFVVNAATPKAKITSEAAVALSQHGTVAPVTLHHRRSEEHTSELQSLMRISYAVFCLKKKKHT